MVGHEESDIDPNGAEAARAAEGEAPGGIDRTASDVGEGIQPQGAGPQQAGPPTEAWLVSTWPGQDLSLGSEIHHSRYLNLSLRIEWYAAISRETAALIGLWAVGKAAAQKPHPSCFS